MKRTLFIACCILLLFSCSIHKQTYSPHLAIYENPGVDAIPAEYIIMRTNLRILEIYTPRYDSVIGPYEVDKDTLFMTPEHIYKFGDNRIEISAAQQDSSYISIPRKYLVKKDCLVDLTDYDGWFKECFPWWPLPDNPRRSVVYERIR